MAYPVALLHSVKVKVGTIMTLKGGPQEDRNNTKNASRTADSPFYR